jgi:transcriptional regulator with XRE-family HTH domain
LAYIVSMVEMSTRIRELRETAKLSQAKFGKLFGVSREAVSQWEKGGGIEHDKLVKMAQDFKVSMDWLTGQPTGSSRNAPFPQKVHNVSPSNHPPSGAYIAHQAEFSSGGEPLPVRGFLKQGEHGYFYENGDAKDWVTRPKGLIGIEGAYAMELRDYSMDPFEPGWWATFNPIKPVRVNNLVAVYLKDGQAMFKKLVRLGPKEIILHQTNPAKDIPFKSSDIEAMHALHAVYPERPV